MYALRQFLAPAIPSCLYASLVALLHKCAKSLHFQGIVVATHKSYARHLALVVVEKGEESLFRKLVANVAAKERAVASRTKVGTQREVYRQRHFVGIFLEYDVVVYVFKHSGLVVEVDGSTFVVCEHARVAAAIINAVEGAYILVCALFVSFQNEVARHFVEGL